MTQPSTGVFDGTGKELTPQEVKAVADSYPDLVQVNVEFLNKEGKPIGQIGGGYSPDVAASIAGVRLVP